MSFFRTPINPEVQKELFRRIEGINKSYVSSVLEPVGDPFENEYFKSCWARVVTIDGNGKQYYLNSQLGEDGKKPITEPLNIKGGDYSRGRAGITSISSNYKEFFLKQSTISFLCPDPKEFEVIQEHFLKHGRYVLVEFGWSTRKNIILDEINTSNLVRFSNNLTQREKNSRGNYTAICGVITNFNFNQKQDGSYEGTFEVSSMGRNILGQKVQTDGKISNLVNFINEEIEDDKIFDNPDSAITETSFSEEKLKEFKKVRESFVSFHATIKSLPNVIQRYVDSNQYPGDKVEGKQVDNLDSITSKNGAAYIPTTKARDFITPGDSEENLAYCTWGWFEDYILNSFFAFTSKSGDEDFKTRFFSVNDTKFDEEGKVLENKSTLCKNNKNLFSLGLQSIILPGQFKQFEPTAAGAPEINPTLETPLGTIQTDGVGDTLRTIFMGKDSKAAYDKYLNGSLKREKTISAIIRHFNTKTNFKPFADGKHGQIRNMVFEANYLMDSFIGTTNVDQALINFWQKVSNDYGNFWSFTIVQDDNTDGKIKVMDLNIGEMDDTNIQPDETGDEQGKISTKDNPREIFKFPLYSKNSFIQDFSLETAYDSEMATLAVFGSNANMSATRGDMGQGYTELAVRALSLIQNVQNKQDSEKLKKRKDYYDDILQNLSVPINTNFLQQGSSSGTKFTDGNRKIVQTLDGGINFPQISEILSNKEQNEEDIRRQKEFSSDVTDIRKGYFWFQANDDTVQIYSSSGGQILNEFKRTMLYYVNKSSDPKDSSNYSVVLPAVPLQLSLTIQGIGGIKIGDLFIIDYLPEIYREFCHFMVVGVSHEISTTGWTTKLDSRMIVDIPKLVKTKPNAFTRIEFVPFKLGPNEQLNEFVSNMAIEIENKNDARQGQQNVKELWEYYGGVPEEFQPNIYKPIADYIQLVPKMGVAATRDPAKILKMLNSPNVKNDLDSGKSAYLIDTIDESFIQRVLEGEFDKDIFYEKSGA